MSLLLKVTREPSSRDSTVGSLSFSTDGGKTWMPSCFTMEDVVRETPNQPVEEWKIHGVTAIPMGEYDVVVDESLHFSAMAGHPVILPRLLNVPGFEGVRMHGGNTAADTEGCIIVGWNRLRPDYIQGNASADVVRLIQKHGGTARIRIVGQYANH